MLTQARRDFSIQIVLPVQFLGDGLDYEIAVRKPREMLFVIGGLDGGSRSGVGQWRGLELEQSQHAFSGDGVLVVAIRRQVEQIHWHAGVGQMRGDLRAHDAGAQHRGAADLACVIIHDRACSEYAGRDACAGVRASAPRAGGKSSTRIASMTACCAVRYCAASAVVMMPPATAAWSHSSP